MQKEKHGGKCAEEPFADDMPAFCIDGYDKGNMKKNVTYCNFFFQLRAVAPDYLPHTACTVISWHEPCLRGTKNAQNQMS